MTMKAEKRLLRLWVLGTFSVGAAAFFMPSKARACIVDNDGTFLDPNCYIGGAANGAIVDTSLDALHDIVDDIVEADVGPAKAVPPAPVQTAPFGVFASGQFAHTEHDGFKISNSVDTFDGPHFDVDEFSAAISVDFNAAKHFGFDNEHGLNLGLFGGYASAKVGVDAFEFFSGGDATNRSGMFGGYGLYRHDTSYMLVAASAFLGNTDVDRGRQFGSYDTQGYAITGSVGRIFNLTDRVRFDLRGGLLGVTFTGDAYEDSFGTDYGKSRLSFGAVKFEPGIYVDFQLGNGMVISPYARADVQQRFGYSNTASVDGVESEFDDADFSVALYSGFNLKVTGSTTLSTEIRGKWSADSTTVSGKLGLKIAF
ncbi:MAG: autotransporter outer membrane beta-barrel domain-containing protein [Mesorhizobium sp.]|uniref:autotransporter outer membrane beta-barrel domain-containing protein n=1 Tax=Mesorhizobium sp. TaxID=1871066 RepID=UPI000FE89265|nr:autotransporter outer membrane beta-barrel domain-containing protein [Mesorhizobium sp.]RWM08937.1 MAG: autotransporter outer membrane beta-barrel domain-containing protein [Mesorhizobium sp.]TIO52672.1 MAG: autotransporter outer membrane beta-barrel domain-containing protein [Mesorhizobium sp.]TIO61681.1 MAG: autotransporter outer membrane beta-barrel domain-containing protein [Mesorhizobium sp.]TJV66383.1 MAG: autotransporter outer membrane beta-barrel domain-containing protein [Mesorhizob